MRLIKVRIIASICLLSFVYCASISASDVMVFFEKKDTECNANFSGVVSSSDADEKRTKCPVMRKFREIFGNLSKKSSKKISCVNDRDVSYLSSCFSGLSDMRVESLSYLDSVLGVWK